VSVGEPQIPIDGLRDAVKAKLAGGESLCNMARDVGYTIVRPDVERLRRQVGLAVNNRRDGRKAAKTTIGRGLAEEIATKLNIDPHEWEKPCS
jgi:hypothetical protein